MTKWTDKLQGQSSSWVEGSGALILDRLMACTEGPDVQWDQVVWLPQVSRFGRITNGQRTTARHDPLRLVRLSIAVGLYQSASAISHRVLRPLHGLSVRDISGVA